MTRLCVVLALLGALLSPVHAAGSGDWNSWKATWMSFRQQKTDGIAAVRKDYIDKRCPLQLTEARRTACSAAYEAIIARFVAERAMINGMLAAAELDEPRRGQFLNNVLTGKSFEDSNKETGRIFAATNDAFPEPKSTSLEKP